MLVKDIPNEPHFAIIYSKQTTIHHEADERSRTHPGHGYPAYSETIDSIEYVFLKTEEDVRNWIIDNEERSQYSKVVGYKVIYVNPVKISTSINVELGFRK